MNSDDWSPIQVKQMDKAGRPAWSARPTLRRLLFSAGFLGCVRPALPLWRVRDNVDAALKERFKADDDPAKIVNDLVQEDRLPSRRSMSGRVIALVCCAML